ncbi:PDZ domain-containing protein, partial [Planctomycetota bacterium]
ELGGSGVGFAIPSNLAAKVLNQVLTHGEVRRGWLGVTVLPSSKLGRKEGALVSSVGPGSPAEDAGIQAGDLVLAIAGTPVSCRFVEQIPPFYQRVADLPIGSEVLVWIERDGVRANKKVVIARMERFLGDQEEHRRVGVTVREITGPMALARRLPTTEGVIVTGLRPGFPLEEARPRLHRGDIVVSLSGIKTPDLAAFAKALTELEDAGEVLVSCMRDEEHLISVMEAEGDEPKPRGGELAKAWLGVKVQVLTPKIAKALDLADRKGFRVTQVFSGTEAARAGLRAGDAITALDGDELDASRPQDSEDLRRRVEDRTVGEEVELSVVRAGKEITVTVVLEESPVSAFELEKADQEDLELTVRNVAFMDRVKHKWTAEQRGVIVVEAVMGGWAHMAGLRRDDLVLSIADREVTGVDGFEKAMGEVMEERPRTIKFFVRRGYRTNFVFVEPDWSQISQEK